MKIPNKKKSICVRARWDFSETHTHTHTHTEWVKFQGVKYTYMQVLAFDAIFHEIPSLQH